MKNFRVFTNQQLAMARMESDGEYQDQLLFSLPKVRHGDEKADTFAAINYYNSALNIIERTYYPGDYRKTPFSHLTKISEKFEKEIIEFATERSSKKVFVTRKISHTKNKLFEYSLFDEKEFEQAKNFAKNNQLEIKELDFENIFYMSDEEFDSLINGHPNAELIRQYRRMLK